MRSHGRTQEDYTRQLSSHPPLCSHSTSDLDLICERVLKTGTCHPTYTLLRALDQQHDGWHRRLQDTSINRAYEKVLQCFRTSPSTFKIKLISVGVTRVALGSALDPPSRVEFAAFTIASISSLVMSPLLQAVEEPRSVQVLGLSELESHSLKRYSAQKTDLRRIIRWRLRLTSKQDPTASIEGTYGWHFAQA